jgi:hypothetical protein
MRPLLRDLQLGLSGLYDLPVPHDVEDFLVTDHALLHALTCGQPGRPVDEKLIVQESDGGLDLALYLDPGVLARLDAADPRRELSGLNLADFWTVLEGISHFLYLAWNASHDKPVTLLELEMQAEVDKYVSTRLLLAGQPTTALGRPLLDRLFVDTVLVPALDAAEQDRYRAASHLAGRYCASLESRYPVGGLVPEMVRELRAFYRLSQSAKVSRIRAANLA